MDYDCRPDDDQLQNGTVFLLGSQRDCAFLSKAASLRIPGRASCIRPLHASAFHTDQLSQEHAHPSLHVCCASPRGMQRQMHLTQKTTAAPRGDVTDARWLHSPGRGACVIVVSLALLTAVVLAMLTTQHLVSCCNYLPDNMEILILH